MRSPHIALSVAVFAALVPLDAAWAADIGPLLTTTWGQRDDYALDQVTKDGEPVAAGCTTLATAQILNYYAYLDTPQQDADYALDNAPLEGDDVYDGDWLWVELTAETVDYSRLPDAIEDASKADADALRTFLFHVGASLNSQFGGDDGASATGRQIENAFRYTWGFNNKRRREQTIIMRGPFGYSDAEWAQLMVDELHKGRPVMYLAQRTDQDVGHAFVIDGFRERDGKVHVNWGWGGYGNGWYEPGQFIDPQGRNWGREVMMYIGLEPEPGWAAEMP